MRALFRDAWDLLRKHVKVLAAMAAVAVVLVLALNIAASRMAQRSSFCDSCHYMAPYVEQWKTSKHAGVECVQCHPYDTKAVALSTIRYLSGAYNPRPRAEVDDQTCLATGWHEQRMLKPQENFRGSIRFDHQAHLKGAVRGIHLRCTSCHNQIVQQGHIAVTDQVCYICHFKGAGKGEAVHRLRGVPRQPQEDREHAGFSFNHQSYLKIGVACSQCHVQVVTGDAGVSKERCATCHVGREERLKDVQFLHETHIAKHKVDCRECHLFQVCRFIPGERIYFPVDPLDESGQDLARAYFHESPNGVHLHLPYYVDPADGARQLAAKELFNTPLFRERGRLDICVNRYRRVFYRYLVELFAEPYGRVLHQGRMGRRAHLQRDDQLRAPVLCHARGYVNGRRGP